MKSKVKDLTSGNLYKNFLLFAVPLVLSSLLSQAFNTVDAVIAGRCIGDAALAATSAASAFYNLVTAFFAGFFTGMGVYVAKLFGAGRYRELKNTVYSMFLLISGAILLFSLAAILLREPLFRFLKVDPAIHEDAMLYFIIIMIGKVFTLGALCWVYTLNALGNSRIPFWVSIIGSLLNLVGNVVSVVVLDMGVGGIAYATLISGFIGWAIYIFAVRRCFAQLEDAEGGRMRFDFSAIRQAMRYAAPSSTQQMVMHLCIFGLSPLINAAGMYATAGYSIAYRAYSLCHSFYYSSSRTVSNYVAQCIGADRYEKIGKGMRIGFLQGGVFTFLPLLPLVFFPRQICGLFFASGYAGEALEIAVRFCRYFLPFILFCMCNNQFHAFLRGFGSMKMLIGGSAFGALCRLALSYLLVGSLAVDGIFLAWVLSWVLEAILSLTIYLTRYRTEAQLRARYKGA